MCEIRETIIPGRRPGLAGGLAGLGGAGPIIIINGIYIYIYIYIHITVDFRNFIVFFWAETLAYQNPTSCQNTSTINLFGFETLKFKIRRLKLWKPTLMIYINMMNNHITIIIYYYYYYN